MDAFAPLRTLNTVFSYVYCSASHSIECDAGLFVVLGPIPLLDTPELVRCPTHCPDDRALRRHTHPIPPRYWATAPSSIYSTLVFPVHGAYMEQELVT